MSNSRQIIYDMIWYDIGPGLINGQELHGARGTYPCGKRVLILFQVKLVYFIIVERITWVVNPVEFN